MGTELAGAPVGEPLLRWVCAERGLIQVYEWQGGDNLYGLFHLDRDGGTLLVNRRNVVLEGLRVMVGWALAISGYRVDGWYALLRA